MQNWTCFTSFNRRLYDIIAAEMLASWLHHWPANARMVIYLEDDIDLPQDPRLEIRSWVQTCGRQFAEVDRRAQHLAPWASDQTRRYTKKGLTFIHMLSDRPGRVCWLDADLLTLEPVSGDVLDRAFNPDHAVSLFDGSRQQPDGTVPWTAESGFVLIDTQHPGFSDFFQRYRDYYDKPRLPENGAFYWDGEILMHAARMSGSYFDLRSQCQGKSSTPMHAHWLGQYFRHIKSKRKKHYSLETYRDYWLRGADIATAQRRFPWQQ